MPDSADAPASSEAPQPTANPSPERGYEFADEEVRVIGSLGKCMHDAGSLTVLSALFAFLLVLPGRLFDNIAHNSWYVFTLFVLLALAGDRAVRAGGHLTKIARTEGADVSHLMAALREMLRMWTMIRTVLVVPLLMVVLLLILALPEMFGVM